MLRYLLPVLIASTSSAQLRADQVLVVYDSRVPDSVLVAEHYAGSANVPGGIGGVAGSRPRVRVFDLASQGALTVNPGTMSLNQYVNRLRDPLRAYLEANDLVHDVRCLVLTKGMPHRIRDTDNASIGDDPAAAFQEFVQKDATYSSVDSELTMLWQDLELNENGGPADSKIDGQVVNPYFTLNTSINEFSTEHIRTAKLFTGYNGNNGQYWTTVDFFPIEFQLTPGDIVLVCRLDGHTVDDVRAMIDRGRHIVIDMDTVGIVLDESDSNGIADPTNNKELDNQGFLDPPDDYETVRDDVFADGRFNPFRVHYDALAGQDNFIVGPNLSFDGEGIVVSDPLILLAHYGSNHAGPKPGGINDPLARDLYAESFNYAPGAIFNTIESFNGRNFGGVGEWQNQEQIADFIAAGGTLGVAHAWEPFSTTIASNTYLVRHFLLGSLTWAEAAYTSFTDLSWQHMVLGDPLARVVRSSEDLDGDGAVDVDDLHMWEFNPTDIDRDGLANDVDRQILFRTIRFYETQRRR
ncbi:MAG: hypothetical protein KDA28_04860 [Phycisphaerales bacterium]|nr:hypothetical protein [Phycisphaerales bacterium]